MRLHSCLKQADNGLIGYLDFRSTSPVEILLPGTADQLNDYVVGVPRRRPPKASPGGVPHVRRAIAIEREVINRKTGSVSNEFIHGITSQSTLDADAESILKTNRKPTENQPKTNRKPTENIGALKIAVTIFLTGRIIETCAASKLNIVLKT